MVLCREIGCIGVHPIKVVQTRFIEDIREEIYLLLARCPRKSRSSFVAGPHLRYVESREQKKAKLSSPEVHIVKILLEILAPQLNFMVLIVECLNSRYP